MKLGCPTTRTILRTCGRITCTVGGFETLLTSALGSPWQPGAARAARRPNTSRQPPPGRPEGTGQEKRLIGDLRGRGRCLRAAAPEDFPASSGNIMASIDN